MLHVRPVLCPSCGEIFTVPKDPSTRPDEQLTVALAYPKCLGCGELMPPEGVRRGSPRLYCEACRARKRRR